MATMTIVHVDNRERGLKALFETSSAFNYEDYKVEFSNLELGDIIIQSGPITLIFERKTFADLYASIQDGRYHHQKKRLLEKYPCECVFYIVEGAMHFDGEAAPVVSAIINTIIRDHIGVFRTTGVDDTFSLITHIMKRVHETPEKYINSISTPKDSQTGCHDTLSPAAIASNKKETTYINMLCQVPGVSLKTARFIAAQYPSVHALISELSQLSDVEKLNKLKCITCTDKKGGTRKISSSVAKCLLDTFFSHGDQSN